MATARKHYFRVADSLLREPWPRDTKLMVVLLMAWLNQRWARDGLSAEEAGRATLTPAALFEITGISHRGYAQKSLRSLEEVLTISVRTREELTEISWPKFAEFQGFASRSGANPGLKLPPPHPHPHKKKEEEEKESAASAAPHAGSPPEGSKKKKRAQQTPFPEPFPPDLRAELQRWAEKNSFTLAQVDLAIQTVADWAVSNGKTKASWVRTIQGAMREGWALNRKPGAPVKEEATRREYLEFGSPEWEKAYGYKH